MPSNHWYISHLLLFLNNKFCDRSEPEFVKFAAEMLWQICRLDVFEAKISLFMQAYRKGKTSSCANTIKIFIRQKIILSQLYYFRQNESCTISLTFSVIWTVSQKERNDKTVRLQYLMYS